MVKTLALLSLAASLSGAQETPWTPLFDGKSLEGWKETPFKGAGAVRVAEGVLTLGPGDPLTGVTRAAPLPVQSDYEVRFEAMRVRGSDFFASLTFPVGEAFATFVTGGWGGDIVGISSVDGWDASENETRTYFNFENGKWYSFRLHVTLERIRAYIDEQLVVDLKIAGRTMGLRPGPIDLSKPFGFASYRAEGALRKVEYRALRPPGSGRSR